MSGIKRISKDELEKTLSNNNRQYLVGDLKLPQELQHIHDGNVGVGISHYKSFTSDLPHIHPKVTEYQLMLQGYSEIKNLITNEITKLYAGDFFLVENGTPYAQKLEEDTKIMFMKHPGMNDKELVEINEETKQWLYRRFSIE